MANADLGSLDFKLHIDDKEFNKSVDDALRRAKSLNTDMSTLLDLRKRYNTVSKEDVTNARNSNRILREENKTREMNRREIIRTRKELVKLNAEKAKANGISSGGNLAAQQSMLSNITNLAMKYVSIWGAASLIKNIASVTAEFELQRIALQAMIADSQKANQVYNQIWDLALKSPFNAKELVTYAKQLVAYSIPVNELFETTKMLADVSAGLGVGMDRLVLAYGQIRSASFLRGQEVRQLTEAGIPILEELRKQFVELGEETITVGDVFDKISKRLVPFEMVEKVFKNMTSEGGKFYQMQEIQSETLKGKIMILKDAYDKMFNAIGEKNRGTIKGAIDWATNLARNYDKTIAVLKSLIAAYGAYKVALELAVLGERGFLVAATIKKITETASRMKRLTGDAKTFAIVMRNMGEANVKKAFATLAGAIALVATALIVAIRNAGALKRELDTIATTKFTEASHSVEDFTKLTDRLQKATKGSQQYRDAISQLNSKYGEYLPNLLNEKNALDEIAASYDRVTNAIYSQAKAYAYEEGMRKLEEKTGIKMNDTIADVVTMLTKEGINKESAQIFVRNLKDALANDDPFSDVTITFKRVWNETMGELENPVSDWGGYLPVVKLREAIRKFKEAEDSLNAAIDIRFGGEGFSTIAERDTIKPILDKYAKEVNRIDTTEMSREEAEAQLLEARKTKLKELIKAYEGLNEAAAKVQKAGLWDNQIKKYTNELKSLEEPDLTWLQNIVNPLVDAKNRDLKPQATDTYEEYVDNLRNIYKKQVTAVSDLSDTYQKYLEVRKKGIKDEDNAYFKSKELYELEKKRKETIEAIGKALGISVDDKVTGNNGKTEEQIQLEMQIATLKDMEKWYDKLKGLGIGDDTIRETLKNFYPNQDILNTSRSFRDELERLANELEKFDKKAAQALRDDISGFGLDDLFDRIKNSLEASKKLETTLSKLKEETTLEGTGTAFDISKIVHDYSKAIRDINDKRQEVWNEAFKSFDSGNHVDVENVSKEVSEWWQTQADNAMTKAVNSIDEKAEQWVKDWAKIKGVNLEDWSDMTIFQLNGVRDALERLFDENGNLKEGEEGLAKIKEDLSQIPGGWEAFVNAIQRGVGVKDFSGQGLLKKLDDMTTKEKVKLVKYAAQEISGLADSMGEFAEMAGDDKMKSGVDAFNDVVDVAEKAGQGAAAGGWIGAIIGGLVGIGAMLLEDATAAERMKNAIADAFLEAKLYKWQTQLDLGKGSIFGEDSLKSLESALDVIKDIKKNLHQIYQENANKAPTEENMQWTGEFSAASMNNYVKALEDVYMSAGDKFTEIENKVMRTRDAKWYQELFGKGDEYSTLKQMAKDIGYDSLYNELGLLDKQVLQAILNTYTDLSNADKQWIKAAIAETEKLEDAYEQLRDVMTSLVGTVVDTYTDAIIDQWIDAGNAAADYADILDDVARAYAKMLIKNTLMNTAFKGVEEEMTRLTSQGKYDEAIAVLEGAMQEAQNLGPVLTDWLSRLNGWFSSDSTNSLGQAVKGVTEDTANLLASYMNGMRGDLAEQRKAVEKIASNFENFWKGTYHPTLDDYLHNIEGYTYDTKIASEAILSELQSVITTDGGSAIRVAKL